MLETSSCARELTVHVQCLLQPQEMPTWQAVHADEFRGTGQKGVTETTPVAPLLGDRETTGSLGS